MKYQLLAAALVAGVSAQSSAYQQCGGIGWSGATSCVSGYSCQVLNSYYSQCLPGTATSPVATGTKTATSAPTGTGSGSGSGTGKTRFAGVNIAGFDFGCGTDGTCNTSAIYAAPNAGAQMSHFVKDDGMNIFRLPVGWQYLTNNVLGGTLNAANLAKYDAEVQSCLSTGAYCIIDIHSTSFSNRPPIHSTNNPQTTPAGTAASSAKAGPQTPNSPACGRNSPRNTPAKARSSSAS